MTLYWSFKAAKYRRDCTKQRELEDELINLPYLRTSLGFLCTCMCIYMNVLGD